VTSFDFAFPYGGCRYDSFKEARFSLHVASSVYEDARSRYSNGRHKIGDRE
jgi:hypothetical protein